jgi:CrcB protein
VPAVRSGDTFRIPEAPLRLAAIAAGGALGTLARYGADRALVPAPLGFPWATFVVNVTGSVQLGLMVTRVVERWPPSRFVRPFAAIGFCGGFTTFSTMMVEAVQRAQHGRAGLAIGYLVASMAAGLLAAIAGMASARGRFRLPADRSIPDPDDLAELYSDPRRPPMDGGARP